MGAVNRDNLATETSYRAKSGISTSNGMSIHGGGKIYLMEPLPGSVCAQNLTTLL